MCVSKFVKVGKFMEYWGAQQQEKIKFCKKCGTQLSLDAVVCNNCGTPVTPNNNPVDKTTFIASAQYSQPQYTQPQHDQLQYDQFQYTQPAPPPEKKKKPIVPIVIVAVVVVVAAVLAILFGTHTICIRHKWKDADCTNPKTCQYCDKTEGEALGHNWTEGSCTEAKVCKNCDKEGEAPKGHVKGEWKTKEAPTLLEDGTEEAYCTVCSELLDEREVDKKTPDAVGGTFNFTDSEFVDWFEDSYYPDVRIAKIEDDKEAKISTYSINIDGDIGLIMFLYDASGNVCAMMTSFEDWVSTVASILLIGEELDSSFSTDVGATYLAYGYTYEAGDLTAFSDVVDGYDVAVLAPTIYFEDTYSA